MLVMSDTLPLATVKARFSEVVDDVVEQHDRVTITRRGRPVAVLLSLEDLQGLEETLEVLSDPEALAQVRAASREAATGDVSDLASVAEELTARQRRR